MTRAVRPPLVARAHRDTSNPNAKRAQREARLSHGTRDRRDPSPPRLPLDAREAPSTHVAPGWSGTHVRHVSHVTHAGRATPVSRCIPVGRTKRVDRPRRGTHSTPSRHTYSAQNGMRGRPCSRPQNRGSGHLEMPADHGSRSGRVGHGSRRIHGLRSDPAYTARHGTPALPPLPAPPVLHAIRGEPTIYGSHTTNHRREPPPVNITRTFGLPQRQRHNGGGE